MTAVARRENLKKYGEQAILSRRLVQLDDHVPVVLDWQAARMDVSDPAGAWHCSRSSVFAAWRRKSGDGQGAAAALRAGALTPAHCGLRQARRGERAPLAALSLRGEGERGERSRSISGGHAGEVRRLLGRTAATDVHFRRYGDDRRVDDPRWPRWAEIVGHVRGVDDRGGWYLPFRAPPGEGHLDPSATLEALRPVLEDPAIGKIGQNLKYDMIVLRTAGVALAGMTFDTMVASYLLDAGRRNHNLNDLAKQYLNHATIKIEELIGSGKHQKRMDQVPVAQVADYAAEDAWLPVGLGRSWPKARPQGLAELLAKLDLPLVEVLAEMEYTGIKVDVGRLAEFRRRFGPRMAALEQEMYELAGCRFNIASPKQLQQLLFVEKKLPVVKRTKTGPSTDVAVLEALAARHPLPEKIVRYRQYAKLKGTYVDALPRWSIP